MVTSAVRTLAAWVFERLGRFRHAPVFHPIGVVLSGRLDVTAPGSALGAVLGAGERPVLVRLSKGIGLPGALPDLLGFALRIPRGTIPSGTPHAVGAPARPLDLLFTTAGRHRVTAALPAPTAGWYRRSYSCLMPYRRPGGRVTLRVEPDQVADDPIADLATVADVVRRRPLRYRISETRCPGGARQAVASILLERVEPGSIAFDPVHNTDPLLHLLRPLAALRAGAYPGSRAGRGAPPGDVVRRPEPRRAPDRPVATGRRRSCADDGGGVPEPGTG